MKFIGFVDLHQDINELMILKSHSKSVDFYVCLGDFTIFGNNLHEMLALFNTLGKKIYVIHGNHESESETRKFSVEYPNVVFVHKQMIDINGKLFVFFGGGGFSYRENNFKNFIAKNHELLGKYKEKILCTHAPPFGTQLDAITEDWHVGVKDFTDFIVKYKPLLAISGHIHESYKQKQVIGDSLLVNPGGDGELFEITDDD
jgi:Icc-related predicted phosphoesterase